MSKNFLSRRDELRKGDSLVSNNGEFKAIFQEDSNFVVYGWQPVWASDTHGSDAFRLVMQDDCNLVMYSKSDKALWSSDSYGPNTDRSRLQLTDDGKLVSGFGVRYLYHHFYLKPTKCAKGTIESISQICAFRNDRPLMDCAVCYKTAADQIETSPKPYVHCIQKPRLTEEMRTTRTEHCKKMSYNSGAPTLLASTG
ncbi:hypothetical protein CesoFtcFv8_025561 [Champsocephalus esox]|uniref:Bulb-type lectin domain-containing protein n=1 Tax=Champsocephalus esox TaxID=159716 RepID=A0AAN8GCZ1_9TELE|nr:hypothetical protein CesoFtcFv8_025560 [Champsocephalus esox]KAK5878123.1 hypothetical protein CesoFtcFv8_025561 [Champsocephalus esox]